MEPGAKENFVRVNIPNPCDHLLMHQQRLQPSMPGLHETDKLIARYREGIDPEAASTVTVKSCPIEQGKPSETARVPIAQFRFSPPRERHADVHVLRVFRLRRAKEKEACHAKLRDGISEFAPFPKPHRDALAVSLYTFQHRAVIPRERGQPFPNNIRSSHPALVELRADEMNP
jgi:hypothetical protein